MLKIEKTLKELRDLQNTLHGLGIEMSIKDADAETKSDYEDAAMTIDIMGRYGRRDSHEVEFVSRCLRVVSDEPAFGPRSRLHAESG